MPERIDFNQWFIDNSELPEAKRCSMFPEGSLKVLIGSMWIKLHDLPEPMLRGVIADYNKAQLTG